jgi:hypothetical protein
MRSTSGGPFAGLASKHSAAIRSSAYQHDHLPFRASLCVADFEPTAGSTLDLRAEPETSNREATSPHSLPMSGILHNVLLSPYTVDSVFGQKSALMKVLRYARHLT